jgi:drug/metabolite transporter (DMT)-like permease
MAATGPHHTRPAVGYAQVLGGAALFGLAAIVSKVALTAGIAPARLSALRCTGSALGLLLFIGLTQPSRLRIGRRDLPLLLAVALTGAALIQWLYFTAIDRLPVGIALLLEFTGPLMIAVYARVVQRQAVSRRVWLALALALVGLALVAQVFGGGAGLDPVGVAAGLAAAVCLAAFYLLSKRALERHHPLTLTFWTFTLAACFWAVVQPWWTFDASMLSEPASLLGGLEHVSMPVWAPVLWLVLLGTLTPYFLEIASLRHLSPTSTGIVGMSEPVIAAVIAWVWLGEALDAPQLIGAVLVLAGVAIVQTVTQPGTEPPVHVVTPSFEPV